MRTNAINAGYAPAAGISFAGRVSNGFARLIDRVSNQVKDLLKAIDCPIETEADRHYTKCFAACLLSIVFMPFLAVAVYQLFKAKSEKGGEL